MWPFLTDTNGTDVIIDAPVQNFEYMLDFSLRVTLKVPRFQFLLYSIFDLIKDANNYEV